MSIVDLKPYMIDGYIPLKKLKELIAEIPDEKNGERRVVAIGHTENGYTLRCIPLSELKGEECPHCDGGFFQFGWQRCCCRICGGTNRKASTE